MRILFKMCTSRFFQRAMEHRWGGPMKSVNCWDNMGKWETACTAQLGNHYSELLSLSARYRTGSGLVSSGIQGGGGDLHQEFFAREHFAPGLFRTVA